MPFLIGSGVLLIYCGITAALWPLVMPTPKPVRWVSCGVAVGAVGFLLLRIAL